MRYLKLYEQFRLILEKLDKTKLDENDAIRIKFIHPNRTL